MLIKFKFLEWPEADCRVLKFLIYSARGAKNYFFLQCPEEIAGKIEIFRAFKKINFYLPAYTSEKLFLKLL